MVRSGALIGLFLVGGCAAPAVVTVEPEPPSTRQIIVLVPDPDGRVGEIVVSTGAGSQTVKEAYTAVEINGSYAPPEAPLPVEKARIEKTFSKALEVTPAPARRFVLYFVSNSTELVEDSRRAAALILEEIDSRGHWEVSVVGHCDTTGSDELNMKLSLERAKAVEEFLLVAGVDPSRVRVAYHGERDLLAPTADDVSEPRNRRVEVLIR